MKIIVFFLMFNVNVMAQETSRASGLFVTKNISCATLEGRDVILLELSGSQYEHQVQHDLAKAFLEKQACYRLAAKVLDQGEVIRLNYTLDFTQDRVLKQVYERQYSCHTRHGGHDGGDEYCGYEDVLVSKYVDQYIESLQVKLQNVILSAIDTKEGSL